MIPIKPRYFIDPNIIPRRKITFQDYLRLINLINKNELTEEHAEIVKVILKKDFVISTVSDIKSYLRKIDYLTPQEVKVIKSKGHVIDVVSKVKPFKCWKCAQQTTSLWNFVGHLRHGHSYKVRDIGKHLFNAPKPKGKKRKPQSGKIDEPKFPNTKAGKADAFYKRLPGSVGTRKNR